MGIRYLPAVDGLRAIAVLAVVAYHAGLPVPAGFVGVDVFFVISGYLITRLLHDEVQATGRIDLLAFYARRVRRILPALLVVVGAVLVVAAALLTPEGLSNVARSAKASLLIQANLFFMGETAGYFGQTSADLPLLHTWSLSVEEQFYLLWPVVLILARRKPAAALAMLALASLALAEWWLWHASQAAFYQMPARAWELALGGLVALRPMAVPKGSAWAGLVLVLIACFVPLGHFPGSGALPATLGAALLIAAVQSGERIAVMEARPVVFVGLISYSLYLWHWPVLVFWRLTHIDPPRLPVSLALCLGAFVLAWISYRYVETPFRRMRRPTHYVVAAGAAACVAAVLVTGAMAQPVQTRAQAQDAALFQPAKVPPTMAVWGDSHARMWSPVIGAMAHAQGRGLARLDSVSCPPVLGDAPIEAGCLRHNTAAMKKMQGMDTVLVSARWLALFGPAQPGFADIYPNDPASVARLVAGVERGIAALHVRRIIIMGPVPQLRAKAERCLAAGVPDRCTMTRAQFDAQAEAPRKFLAHLAATYPNVEVIDPADFLCNKVRCPVTLNGVTLYRDDDHVSEAAARLFARSR